VVYARLQVKEELAMDFGDRACPCGSRIVPRREVVAYGDGGNDLRQPKWLISRWRVIADTRTSFALLDFSSYHVEIEEGGMESR
jgi:hypothetical protein